MFGECGTLTPSRSVRWWGPNGHTLLSYEVDFGDGGACRLRVRSPEGLEYWVDDAHLELVEPERIVFTGTLCPREQTGEAANTMTFRPTESEDETLHLKPAPRRTFQEEDRSARANN